MLQIEYDPAGDAGNIEKHGAPFSQAALIEWDAPWTIRDERRDNGGERRLAVDNELNWPVLAAHQMSASPVLVLSWDSGQGAGLVLFDALSD
jgi:uncharacterized DUF497 family protein